MTYRIISAVNKIYKVTGRHNPLLQWEKYGETTCQTEINVTN
jgi:hypothetical protein